jgi:hypothetical protein
MPLSPETEAFLQTWRPTSVPNQCDIREMIQHFESVYKIYNRLFNEVSVLLGNHNRPDKQGATAHVVQYLTAKVLAGAIEGTQETRNSFERLKDFVRQHTYNFELDGGHGVPAPHKDHAILTRMESREEAVRMEGLLYLIYKVRCNIAHGQKHRTEHQLPLMQAVIPVLELVASKMEEKLRA